MSSIEILTKLRENRIDLTENQVIELCFQAMDEVDDPLEKCRVAVRLSGIVQRGLGDRTQKFLDEHPDLPERAREILSSSILRMEGF